MNLDCTLVTCEEFPELDPDDRLLAGALRDRGLAVAAATWTDPRVDWSTHGLCVLRSTWDYHRRYDDFIAWVDRVDAVTGLCNRAPLLKWNAHKRYIREIEAAGVPVVPTEWVARGGHARLAELVEGRGWRSVVVKPACGAAAYDVARVSSEAASLARGQAHLDRLLWAQDALVQPYLPAVETLGERALIFLDGRYSHAVVKKPFDTILVVSPDPAAVVRPSPDEIEVAERALAAVPGRTIYARVDLLHDEARSPLVSEVELIEPGLYFGVHAPARQTLADAIVREIG